MKINGRRRSMLANTVIITVTSLFLNFCAVYFRLWLATMIGEDGIGVYSLIISVYSLLATVATSGLSFTVTRTVTETLATKKAGVGKIMLMCMILGLVMGFAAFSLLFFGADFTACKLIKEPSVASCLRILACGLPFMSVASCMSGYFIALRRAAYSSAVQMTEELSQIFVSVALFFIFRPENMKEFCLILVAGTAVSEILSAVTGFFFYRISSGGFAGGKPGFSGKDIVKMTVPMSVSGYLRSGLSTLENLSVPLSLQSYGLTRTEALSVFGLVKGLTVPVIFFPAIILNAVSRLLMPEIAEYRAKGDRIGIDATGSAFILVTYAFSVLTGAVFFFFADRISLAVFGNADAALTIKLLAPLIPFMYIDGIIDSILKGMNEQLAVMRFGLAEAVSRILLVFLLIPRTGYYGFIFTIYTGNLINTILGVIRFNRVIRPLKLRKSAFASLSIAAAVSVFPFAASIRGFQGIIPLVVSILLSAVAFTALILCLGLIKKEDINSVRCLLLK